MEERAIQTKYITVDEFEMYSGINLDDLYGGAFPDSKKQRFLKQVEDRLEAIINEQCFKCVEREYPHFNDNQKRYYKLALIEQGIYIFRNGELSTDSGIDPEKGVVIPKDVIDNCVLARNAKRYLKMCGIYTHHIRSRDWSGYMGWW